MNDTRMSINLKNMEIILIGTAHVSQESINEVNEIIREERPDLICVELDQTRYESITSKEKWEKLDMIKIFREGKGFLLMANLVLSGFQRRMGAELGIKPGDEMKAALDLAGELNIPYALCDREVQITLRRAWANCGLWNRSKLLAALLTSAFSNEKLSSQEIEDLKKRSELDGMMAELASYLPEVKETLIDERDKYLASKIWTNAENLQKKEAASPKRIVAVVGAGHMQGIREHLEKIAAAGDKPVMAEPKPAIPESSAAKSVAAKSGTGEISHNCLSDVSELEKIPSRGIISRIIPFLIPAAILALICYGFIRHGSEMSLSMLRIWIFWNGSLAALGTIIALGHPFSIITAFIAAPITTVTPFLGVGMFSGLVQVLMHKPRVTDAQNIIDDVGSLKGFYRNRITRALLVFFFTQLGGVIGTFLTVPALAAGLLTS